MVEVELDRVMIGEREPSVVVLKEKEGVRQFPILVGHTEASAISRGIKRELPPRPMTHELLAKVIVELEGSVERVVVNDLMGGTYFAQLVIRHNGELTVIDSRPSDAIALAVMDEAPIFVDEEVLNEAWHMPSEA